MLTLSPADILLLWHAIQRLSGAMQACCGGAQTTSDCGCACFALQVLRHHYTCPCFVPWTLLVTVVAGHAHPQTAHPRS